MDDLFFKSIELEPIPLVGAEILYLPHLDLGRDNQEVLESLVANTSWQAEKITMWGKTYLQPRLVAWFGDEGKSYSYSGIRLSLNPWTQQLMEIKEKVELITQTKFNSVLLNYYRDHRDSMGFHSDNERELGEHPVIASLSLGAERTLIFKHKNDKFLKPVHFPLTSGSLLIMKGDTQKNWVHGIEKERKECGPRLNLTFRQIIS